MQNYTNYRDRKEVVYLTIHIHTHVKLYISFSFSSFIAANGRSVFELRFAFGISFSA